MRYFLLALFLMGSLCTAQERPLKVNDAIQLTVFGEASLGMQVKIDSSGSVNFPLVGNIQVVGKSAGEVAQQVKTLLQKDYIKDPNVTVSVVSEFIPEKDPEPIIRWKTPPTPVRPVAKAAVQEPQSTITVMGEVKAPGTIRFSGSNTDILTIIAQVRGLTTLGNPKRVQIRRVGDDAKIFTVDINKLSSSTEQVFVQSGDTITVPKRLF